jgi:hypothetical protein
MIMKKSLNFILFLSILLSSGVQKAIGPELGIFIGVGSIVCCSGFIGRECFIYRLNRRLNRAINNDDEEMVQQLINQGVDPNRIVPFSQSHLYNAIEKRRYNLLRLLLEHGAQPDTMLMQKIVFNLSQREPNQRDRSGLNLILPAYLKNCLPIESEQEQTMVGLFSDLVRIGDKTTHKILIKNKHCASYVFKAFMDNASGRKLHVHTLEKVLPS